MIVSSLIVAAALSAADTKIPDTLQVPTGNHVVLTALAEGSQNYVCLPGKNGSGFAWALFGPQATLFDAKQPGAPIGTHFSAVDASGTVRPSWQANDGSRAVGTLQATAAVGGVENIPWLLLKATTEKGQAGGTRFATVSYVQRIETKGGIAPSRGCAAASDVGGKSFVPYSATYIFFAP